MEVRSPQQTLILPLHLLLFVDFLSEIISQLLAYIRIQLEINSYPISFHAGSSLSFCCNIDNDSYGVFSEVILLLLSSEQPVQENPRRANQHNLVLACLLQILVTAWG